MFYYLFDNIVWVANMGALNKEIQKMGWRQIKDTYSLIKVTSESLRNLLKLNISIRKQAKIEKQLFTNSNLQSGSPKDLHLHFISDCE